MPSEYNFANDFSHSVISAIVKLAFTPYDISVLKWISKGLSFKVNRVGCNEIYSITSLVHYMNLSQDKLCRNSFLN
jgi:hypothetical protein